MDNQAFFILAAVYCALFVVVGAMKPAWMFVLIIAAAPFPRSIPGLPVKLSLSDLNVVLAVIVLLSRPLRRRPPLILGLIATPIIAYMTVCVVSSASGWRGMSSLVSLIQMVPYFVCSVGVFAATRGNPNLMLLGFKWLVGVGVFLAISVIIARSGYVYGIHKNNVGSSLACILVVTVEFWFAASQTRTKSILVYSIAILAAALLITVSRGAWMGAIAGLVVVFWARREIRVLTRSLIILIPVITIVWQFLPEEDRDYAIGFDPGRANISSRIQTIEYTMTEFQKSPIIGVGVGLRKEQDATNLITMTLAETGVLGLAAFLAIHLAVIRMAHDSLRVVTPQAGWPFSVLVIGTALLFVKFAHGLVDHYWSRGMISLAWAGAGMVLGVYSTVRAATIPMSRPSVRPRLDPAPAVRGQL